MSEVREMLEGMVEGFRLFADEMGKSFDPEATEYSWFLRNGNFSGRGIRLPEGFSRMEPQRCFENATRLFWERKDLRYCEGYAMRQDIPLPILHGWCVTPEGEVIDPTWSDPEGEFYFGVLTDRDEYMKWLVETKWFGLIGTGCMASRALLLLSGSLTDALEELDRHGSPQRAARELMRRKMGRS